MAQQGAEGSRFPLSSVDTQPGAETEDLAHMLRLDALADYTRPMAIVVAASLNLFTALSRSARARAIAGDLGLAQAPLLNLLRLIATQGLLARRARVHLL
jgi:hypothetical protein